MYSPKEYEIKCGQKIVAYKLPVVLLLSLHTISSVIAKARAQANTVFSNYVERLY